MIISILTLFPEMFIGPFDYSILNNARKKNLLNINFINIRDFSSDKYKTVDDRPYGGGVGMIMKVDIIDKAIAFAKLKHKNLKTKTILLDPTGDVFCQQTARDLTKFKHLILICGHYEGVDARVYKLIDQRISIGNYVLTGGEIPAMVITDTVCRLIKGVLKTEATNNESFAKNNLEHPQYTRPEIYKNWQVPKVLLSGNHQKIIDWKNKHSSLRSK